MDVIFLKISQSWRSGMDDDAVYEAARGNWVAAAIKRLTVTHAVAVAGGRIRGVYRIHSWESAPAPEERRWRFVGRPDRPDLIGQPDPTKRNQNPVQYGQITIKEPPPATAPCE